MSEILLENPSIDSDAPTRAARIQRALDADSVRLGPGVWETTTISLRSGRRFLIPEGATLRAAPDATLYPELFNPCDNKDQSAIHLIHANEVEDVWIGGGGTIDGSDLAFWEPCADPAEWPYGIFHFRPRQRRLSPMIHLLRCRRVRVENLTLQRSPGWTLHFFDCEDVSAEHLILRNHLYGPNTDGININGCRRARVAFCDVHTGDDAFCVKATNRNAPCTDVIVEQCRAITRCGAFAVGAETVGGIARVHFRNCHGDQSHRLIAVEMWDVGSVEDVLFQNITGSTLTEDLLTGGRAVYIDIQQFLRPEARLGAVRCITVEGLHCATRGRILLTAQDGAVLEDVTLRDVLLDYPDVEDSAEAAAASRSWQFSNHSPRTRRLQAAIVADNIRGLTIEAVEAFWPIAALPTHALALRNVEALRDASPRLRASATAASRILNVS
jgi:hypothetical protein